MSSVDASGAGADSSGRSPRRGRATDVRVLALRPGRAVALPDRVATEEPLQIRVQPPRSDPVDVAVTLRTPGHDHELAVGYLLGEGLIEAGDVTAVVGCERPASGVADGQATGNVVTVGLAGPLRRGVPGREGVATSSCGACGKTTVDDLTVGCPPVASGLIVPADVVHAVPGALRGAQGLFERTGGVHAAGELTATGAVVAVREDVGRHNALDKVVGRRVLAGAPPAGDRILALSGRIAFELVQKAALAGFGLVVAVGAPSSLAIDAAERLGVTLVGFVRDGRANVYTHPERIAADIRSSTP